MISDYPLLALGVALLFPLGAALFIRHQIAVGRVRDGWFVSERSKRPVDFWVAIGVQAVTSIFAFFFVLFLFANQSRHKTDPAPSAPQAPQIDGVLAPAAPTSPPVGGVPVPIHNPLQLPISDRSEWKRGG